MVQTRSMAFRPATVKNHLTMFRAFLTFCLFFGFEIIDPSPQTICLYTQFLVRSFSSPQSITNYVAAISLLNKFMGTQATHISSFEVQLMLRAIKLTIRHIPNQRLPITPTILKKLCILCDTLGNIGLILKTVYLFAFYSFIRQSNLAPQSDKNFDPSRHTARGDIIFHNPGIIMIIKWSKTLQTGQTALIPIPSIKNYLHCPVKTFRRMCTNIPAPNSAPLFIFPGGPPHISITIPYLQKTLAKMLKAICIQPLNYSLHSFRRGGASSTYHAGVGYTEIQRHGTWASDAFWNYITTDTTKSILPKALANYVLKKS